ncbi:hypothetical protein RND71_001869 [Anisodus tanguticus]|uniref:Uncharacterized protein n=1 Tax=Anisodus tanguticus TaxID=243964 RepID=A0AAE1T1N1_9SOLA|nr:hypothetical protein RND71_001869 [Anisodus tanguticus]
MREIAQGLELRNINFIWVIRFPVGDKTCNEETIPKGYLDQVRGRGLVVEGWAQQARIIAHSSIGSFFDQYINARLVELVGVGVEVIKGDDGRLKEEEITRAMKYVVLENTGKEVRKKVRTMSDKIKMGADKEIDRVIKVLEKLCEKHKQQE